MLVLLSWPPHPPPLTPAPFPQSQMPRQDGWFLLPQKVLSVYFRLAVAPPRSRPFLLLIRQDFSYEYALLGRVYGPTTESPPLQTRGIPKAPRVPHFRMFALSRPCGLEAMRRFLFCR